MMEQEFHGCKVALFIGEKLLMILRDDDPSIPYPNMWDIPGGGREGAETPEETLAREVMEEVGLIIPDAAFVWKMMYDAEFYPGTKVWFFVARLPAGTERDIVFGDEGQRWAIMPMQEFLALDNVVASYARRLADWSRETGEVL